MKKSLSVLLALTVLLIFNANAQNTLIPFGSSWQYLDDGSNQGTTWPSVSFNSSTWKTGVAKFGYGILDAKTSIGFGPNASNKYVTTYFRKTISLQDPSALGSFSAKIRLDDGAVIYVNGVEVYRLHMPTGAIAYNTFSALSSSGDGTKTLSFNISSAPFVSGTNVIAVEIHQSKPHTSDMAFDMELNSSQFAPDNDTEAPAVVSIKRHSPTNSTIAPGTVTFRTIFSEPVNGVTADDFVTAVTGTATGTISSVASQNASTYDVTVNATGEGTLRLHLKSSGTGITDLSANPVNGGYTTGETYTLDIPDAPANALFAFGASWKYLDNGTDQGSGWKASSFADGAWKTGSGKFGYGITDATTSIGFGPNASNKYVTTYFRKAIALTEPSSYGTFTASIKMDDGVVVYVNGVEVYRMNMPTGSIAYTTFSALSSSGDGTKIQTFTINNSAFANGINVIAVEVHQSKPHTSDMAFDMQLTSSQKGADPVTDTTPPTVVSSLRQSPTTATVAPGPVTFRVSFSEPVTGVSSDDFFLTVNGTAGGTVAGVASVGAEATAYDVAVNATGSGSLRLDLKGSGTGITDGASNAFTAGYASGESYTIQEPPTTGGPGFASVTNLTPMPISTNTADKPQSKIWTYAGKYWTVLPTADGTFLWRLDGTSWTKMLQLGTGNLARTDSKVVGNVVHVLSFRGDNSSHLYSLQYDVATSTYKLWSQRPARVALLLGPGGETATLDIDGNGRMWVAYDTPGEVNVRWSDSPYSTWSEPIAIETGITGDDICAVIALPNENKIAVLWSNQTTDLFGMKTHTTGDSPTSWSEDELPASQSALNIGTGFSDDHINMALASDGTLYCAVKTSYDTPGHTKLALLVRRPNGVWDNMYEVSEFEGTRPIVMLNEAVGKIRIVYTSQENGGDILYRESDMSAISFSSPITLLNGMYNYVSSTKANYTSETVIIATDVSTTAWKAVGFLVTDAVTTSTVTALGHNIKDQSQKQLKAYPNPFTGTATVNFTLPTTSDYSLVLYNSKGEQVTDRIKGTAVGGLATSVEVKGSNLPNGLYILKLQTSQGIQTLKLLHYR